MQKLFALVVLVFAVLPVGSGMAGIPTSPAIGNGLVEHGGGCRKSSPAGQCCHMERRTGTVHCH